MLTLDRLKYFVEVATTEHVIQASKALGVSPSVVSSAIHALENEFGHQLFIRKNQRLRLSEEGKKLLIEVKKLLSNTRDLYNCFDLETTKLKGHLKIGASHFLMGKYLVPAVLKIQNENPDLTVEFISLDSGIAVAQVLNGILDAALIFRSSFYQELNETILHSGHFEVTVKKNHSILKMNKSRIVEYLNTLPAITFRTSFGPNFWENHPAFKAQGIRPKHTYFYEDTQTAIELLKNTQGWAFFPNIVTNSITQISSIRITDQKLSPVSVSLITHKDRARSIILEKVLNQLKKSF